ncbi:hypothetical protein [Deinococcus aquatilis]|uniref:hypothetical protein n=1 Tax=Deinococcus aquatilis TaxID=519440 RepID=UPI00036B8F39|nr:hypothetical protein [Deinococcus aquatilis]
MKNKSLTQLADELADLVQAYESTSAQLLSHPVFPEMPDAAGVENVLRKVSETLNEDLHRSAARVQTELEQLRKALQTMDTRQSSPQSMN